MEQRAKSLDRQDQLFLSWEPVYVGQATKKIGMQAMSSALRVLWKLSWEFCVYGCWIDLQLQQLAE